MDLGGVELLGAVVLNYLVELVVRSSSSSPGSLTSLGHLFPSVVTSVCFNGEVILYIILYKKSKGGFKLSPMGLLESRFFGKDGWEDAFWK